MEKLTIKELAPYLPYGLKVRVEYHSQHEGRIFNFSPVILLDFSMDEYIVKPILRPLSDLTEKHIKEIYSQSPNTPNWSEFYKEWINEKCNLSETIIEYAVVEMLFEWHFDVFGLREKGLCIYYNEL